MTAFCGWRSRLARLPRDQRGAVLIPALIMGAVLAGAMAHLADIHTAISYREGIQDAADVAAGEGAFWHAQGMNLLALLNILMAVVLSLFVVLRLAELIAVAVAIIAAFVPGGAGVAAQAARQAEQFYRWERKLAPPIMRTLNWGTKIEAGVAAAFPYVALAASAAKHSGRGFAWSPSLFPTAPDQRLSRNVSVQGVAMNTFPKRLGGELGADLSRRVLGRFPKAGALAGGLVGSLPVEAEDYYQLCSRAAEQTARYAFLDHIPWVAEGFGWLGGNAPSLVCQPLSEAKNLVEKQIESDAKKGAEAHCDAEEKAWQEQEQARREQARRDRTLCQRVRDRCRDVWDSVRGRPRSSPPPPEWSAARRKNCRREKADSLRKDAQKQADKLRQADELSTDTIKTAKLWSLIVGEEEVQAELRSGGDGGELSLRSPFLHVWSHHADAPPSVAVEPGWIRVLPSLPTGTPAVDYQLPRVASFEPNISSAKAIYYYHCTERGDLKLRNCADNALWHLQWRYKFGVDRDAATELSVALGDAVRGYISYMTGQFLSGVLGKVLAGLGRDGGAADRWQRDAGNRAVRIDPEAIWLRRLTGAALTRNAGKIHGAFWAAPNALDKGLSSYEPFMDIVYMR